MKYESLLKTWCDGLINRQINDAFDKELNGGFLCPACKITHGRGDNAVFPFYYMYSKTGDEKYKKAAELCFDFQKNWLCDDGGVYNDNGGWQPISVFSCIGYIKALKHFGNLIENRTEFYERTLGMANWVYKNLVKDFHSNINYQCAVALCMALAGEYFGKLEFEN